MDQAVLLTRDFLLRCALRVACGTVIRVSAEQGRTLRLQKLVVQPSNEGNLVLSEILFGFSRCRATNTRTSRKSVTSG